MRTPRVLIIAGSDSGGGAGIQADIKTVTMLGGHAMTAITAVTAQNTLGVQGVMPVPAEMVMAQIDSVADDIGIDAVKIGMVGSVETANAVADRLETLDAPVVFDPVMVATSGAALADDPTIAVFERLMRLATVATPNRLELEVLAGMSITKRTDRDRAVEKVMDRTNCRAVLAKGGHAFGHDDDDVEDWLYTSDCTESHWTGSRIATCHTHGTGCTLASAIATGLGQGLDLPDAVNRAIAFVRSAILAAPGLGQGNGPLGQQHATDFLRDRRGED